MRSLQLYSEKSSTIIKWWLCTAVFAFVTTCNALAAVSEFRISNGAPTFPDDAQFEPAMAVNPTDSSNAISAAFDLLDASSSDPGAAAVYTTLDSGTTWQRQTLKWGAFGLFSISDEVAAFGPKPDGVGGFSYTNGARAYVAALVGGGGGLIGYFLTHSDDKGVTWSDPVQVDTTDYPAALNK